jgi:hypothetical protein
MAGKGVFCVPIYWINTKGKGLSSAQITEAQTAVDNSGLVTTDYDYARRSVRVTVLGNYSKSDLPELPYGLTYDDSLNA